MSLLRIPVEWQNWKSTIGASKATSHGDFEKPASGLQRQFRFLIDMGAYHFLYVVQEEVTSYEDWCAPPVAVFPRTRGISRGSASENL